MAIQNIHGVRSGDSLSNDAPVRSVTSFIVTLTAVTTASVVVWGGLRWYYLHHRRKLSIESSHEKSSSNEQTELRQLQQQRKEERTGRIRAEVRLRTTLKQLQQLQQLQLQLLNKQKSNGEHCTNDRLALQKNREYSINSISDMRGRSKTSTRTDHNNHSSTNGVELNRTMVLNCIGAVITPYTKRMGTPRQGALVPASRGYIQLHHHVPADVADGLELYSHIWVLFEFHANTDLNGATVDVTTDHNTMTNCNVIANKTKKSKIRPPRGNGIKVGQLATRSPHRPNPIGLSLVSVERWDVQLKRLYISGIDIVNGTPVYDIKPVVPWDVPGYSQIQHTNTCIHPSSEVLRVPDWVSNTDDVIDTVTVTITAQAQLQQCIHHGHLAPLYTNENDGMIGAIATIQQILAQDPRSSHKGLKSNARGTKVATPTTTIFNEDSVQFITTAPSSYSLVFCNVKISFTVTESDGCRVVEVIPIEFDSNQYVDGVPIITEGLTLD